MKKVVNRRRNYMNRKHTVGPTIPNYQQSNRTENNPILEQILVQLISIVGAPRTEELLLENFSATPETASTATTNTYRPNQLAHSEEPVLKDLIYRLEKVEKWIEQQEQLHQTKDHDENGRDFELWFQVLSKIQQSTSKPSFDTWFAGTSAKRLDDDVIIIECKSEFHADWLEQRYKEEIFFAIKEVAGRSYDIDFINIGKWERELY